MKKLLILLVFMLTACGGVGSESLPTPQSSTGVTPPLTVSGELPPILSTLSAGQTIPTTSASGSGFPFAATTGPLPFLGEGQSEITDFSTLTVGSSVRLVGQINLLENGEIVVVDGQGNQIFIQAQQTLIELYQDQMVQVVGTISSEAGRLLMNAPTILPSSAGQLPAFMVSPAPPQISGLSALQAHDLLVQEQGERGEWLMVTGGQSIGWILTFRQEGVVTEYTVRPDGSIQSRAVPDEGLPQVALNRAQIVLDSIQVLAQVQSSNPQALVLSLSASPESAGQWRIVGQDAVFEATVP